LTAFLSLISFFLLLSRVFHYVSRHAEPPLSKFIRWIDAKLRRGLPNALHPLIPLEQQQPIVRGAAMKSANACRKIRFLTVGVMQIAKLLQ
jgi:hypothetical protein